MSHHKHMTLISLLVFSSIALAVFYLIPTLINKEDTRVLEQPEERAVEEPELNEELINEQEDAINEESPAEPIPTESSGGGGRGSGGPPPTCSDGTGYNSCSIQQPLYCSNGNLVNNCLTCGCNETICNQNGNCTETDTLAPTIELNEIITNNTNINITYVAKDASIDSCILHLDNINKIQNPINYSINIFSLILNEGKYNYSIECNDSSNNLNIKESNIIIDTTNPIINLEYPTNNSNLTNSSLISFNYSIIDKNIKNCSLYLKNRLNQTSNGTNFTLNLNNGDYNYYIECYDIINNIGISNTFNFNLDYNPPLINLIKPDENKYLKNITMNISAYIYDEDGIKDNPIAYISYLNNEFIDIDNITLYDDGLHNDNTSNDGIYGNTWHIGTGFRDGNNIVPGGNYSIFIETEDNIGAKIKKHFDMFEISNCAVYFYSGDSSTKLDVVFIGDELGNISYSGWDVSDDIVRFADYFLNFEPFKTYQNKINIFWVDQMDDLGCYIDYTGHVSCYNQNALNLASQCLNDEIVALVNRSGTAGGYGGGHFSSIPAHIGSSNQCLMHEFGHSFAGLIDLYYDRTCVTNCKGIMCSGCFEFYNNEPCSNYHFQQVNQTLQNFY